MGSPGIGPNAGGPCAPGSGPPPSRCRATFCGRGGDTGRGSAGWCSPSWARRTGAAGARGEVEVRGNARAPVGGAPRAGGSGRGKVHQPGSAASSARTREEAHRTPRMSPRGRRSSGSPTTSSGALRAGVRARSRVPRGGGVDGGAIRVRGRRVRTRVAGRRGGDARASRGVRASPVRCGGGRGVRATREPAAVERRTPRRRRARHAAGNANRRHAAKRKRRHHREKVASRSGRAPSRRGQAVRRLGRRRRAARYKRVTAQESFRVRSALVCYSKEILALRSRLVASRPRA